MTGLDRPLAALHTLTVAELGTEWRRLRKTDPRAHSVDLLRRGLGWQMQAQVSGGLSREAERELSRVAAGSVPVLPTRATASLRAGTRLVRSWHGTTYAVLVTETGFEFNERSYTSLTMIAREITGAAWSGPRFFGLTGLQAGKRARTTVAGVDA